MFRVRDLMIQALPDAQLGPQGGIVCIWPSFDCCGPNFSNPGGPIGVSRWMTEDLTDRLTLTQTGCRIRLSLPPTGCGVNYSTCATGSVTFTLDARITGIANPAELKVLRDQLETALQAADRRDAELRESLAPQSVEEISRLEEQMQQALDALGERRAELEARQAKGS